MTIIQNAKIRRARRVRAKINGTADKPRVSVFRSNKTLYAQAIDDVARATIASVSTKDQSEGVKAAQSEVAGKKMGEALKKKGIKKAVFDRGPYLYHGRVKAFVEGLRDAGLEI